MDPPNRTARLGRRLGPPILVPVLLLAAAFTAGAQEKSLRFGRLTVDQGLSQGTINAVLQDRVGFLWIGTQDGLNRYDGYGFRVYRDELTSGWVSALAEDPSGDLWIGTEGGGLSRWHADTDTFTHFRHDPDDPASLPSDRVRVLAVEPSGDLWVGTFDAGLARLDAATGKAERFRHREDDDSSLSDDRIRSLARDRSGHLWIGTVGGLNRLDDPDAGTVTSFRHDPDDPATLSDDRVTAIHEDHQGTLWVGTEKGLNRREGRGFVRTLHDPDDPTGLANDLVWALFEDRDHRLWIGTDGGLHLARPPGEGFSRYLNDPGDPSSLANDRVLTLSQDRGGVVWIGTQGGGLSKWNPITWSFAHYKADPENPAGLSSNAVFAFAEDERKRLWIGTFGGGINVFDRTGRGRFTHYHHDPNNPRSLSDDSVLALLRDHRGDVWAGTPGGGLNRFDAATGTFVHFRHDPERPGSLSDDSVISLYEDAAGTLWVGTHRGGLDAFDRDTGTFTHHRHDPAELYSLSGDQVTALVEARGVLWVATFGAGLNALDRETGTFTRFRHDPSRPGSLSSDTVYALHVDPQGDLWVGTQAGLDEMGPTSFEHHAAGEVVWAVYSDAHGHLWLATNNGIAELDPARGVVRRFDQSHGLQGNEFNFGAHFEGSGGELFFGGTNGFNVFKPEEVELNTAVPPVVLTDFTKLNRSVPLGRPAHAVDEVVLDHTDDVVAFEFAALDYTAPEKNLYRFQLEGFQDEWIDNGPRRLLTFTDLDPGNYVLRVQGSNNDGVWNEDGASLRVVVEPPFWQTWWFRLGSTLALVSVLWTAHLRRIEKATRRQQMLAELERAEERERLIARLEAKNAELERFTYTVSHDLKAPLVTIRGFLGFVRQEALAVGSERLIADLERIDDASRKMSVLLEDLLQLSRIGRLAHPPVEVGLGEIVAEAVSLVSGQILERGVEVVIAPDLPRVFGDRARLVEVFQNLVQNAVKYMGDQASPRLEIGVREDRRDGDAPARVFYVRDNGTGIDPQYHERVFDLFQRLTTDAEGTGIGLALVKRIVETHHGQIWVESEGAGHGSTFCFTLDEEEGDPSASLLTL